MLQAGATFKAKPSLMNLPTIYGQNKHQETLVNPVAPAHIWWFFVGTAVAVSAPCRRLGTDTGGSIRVPSSYQGLLGRTARRCGLRQYGGAAPSFDTVGWMTRGLTMTKVANVCIDSVTQSEISGSPRFGIAAHLFEQAAHKSLCKT